MTLRNDRIERLLFEHAAARGCGLLDADEQPPPAAPRVVRVAGRRRLAALAALSAAVVLAAWSGGWIGPHADRPEAEVAGADGTAAAAVPAVEEEPPARATVRAITFDRVKFALPRDEAFEPQRITPEIRELAGERVRIRGYMLPHFVQSGITRFVLVRDNMECCFGPGAALYDCMLVDMRQGESTEYRVRPVTVEGAFAIRPELDAAGQPLVLYHLEDSTVH